MKLIQIILTLLAFMLATVSCSPITTKLAKKQESSSETTSEQKVIERISFSTRDLDVVHILFEDGSIYTKFVGDRDSPSHLAQKGDTVVIKNGEISEIKFVMSK